MAWLENKHKTVLIKQNGFTILEVITAIFILTVGVGGVFSLIIQTISSSSRVELKLIAAYLAQEGIEIVRNIRDTNWLQSRTASSPWDDGLPQGDWEADYTTVTFSDTANFEQCGDAGHNCDTYDGDLLKIDGGFYNYNSGADTKFKRKITITPQGQDTIEVKVRVEWQEKNKTHYTEVLERITNWYEK